MLIAPTPKLPLKRRLAVFFKSYPGWALILGVFCLGWSILYKTVFLNIETSCDFMVALGEVFYAVALSVVASVIFYYVTVFIPNVRKKRIADKLILWWLQQLDFYGKKILEDVVGVGHGDALQMSKDEWISYCDKKLSEKPVLGQFYTFYAEYNNWFEYFDEIFNEEDYYMQKCLQYQECLPLTILEKFEYIEIHGNLRYALRQYQNELTTGRVNSMLADDSKVDFNAMKKLAPLIWNHCQTLRTLINEYQSTPMY